MQKSKHPLKGRITSKVLARMPKPEDAGFQSFRLAPGAMQSHIGKNYNHPLERWAMESAKISKAFKKLKNKRKR